MNLSTEFLQARRTVAGLAALSTMVGCSGAIGAVVAPTAAPAATGTKAAPTATAAPSNTPQPTATATTTVTPTPSIVTVTPKEGDIPCRFGPGRKFSVENALLAGRIVPVLGRDAASDWIQIDHPRRPGWRCWVEAAVAVVDGDLARAPVIAAPEAFVESISIDTDHTTLSGADCTFPRSFEVVSWITTNGPARVTFQRVRGGRMGDPETTVFPFADTKQFVDVYTLTGQGDYSFAMVVFSPNGISETKDFSVRCVP